MICYLQYIGYISYISLLHLYITGPSARPEHHNVNMMHTAKARSRVPNTNRDGSPIRTTGKLGGWFDVVTS